MTALSQLTPAQAEAATLSGPVLALSGAGTGKTKTLTAGIAHRIEQRGIAPSRLLAVTFTNKAAAEMKRRVQAGVTEGRAPSWIGTFHGLGARQLRAEPEVAGLRDGFEIVDADDSKRIIRRLLQTRSGGGDADDVGTLGRDPVKLTANKISGFKDALLTSDAAISHVEALISARTRSGSTTDNGMQFRLPPRYADGPTAACLTHMFDLRCREKSIEHRFTKINHPWTNGQVERMNRTIKEATVRRYRYDRHDQLRRHLGDFVKHLQLRPSPQDTSRPHTFRVHLQSMGARTRTVHP